MKYYINLIKNKKYIAIMCCIALIALGVCMFYINLKDVIDNEIQQENSAYTGVLVADVLSGSNLGLLILGLGNIYIGLIFGPRNCKGSQNDEDYEVKSIDDCIYIKYKNKEFLVKKETFGPTNLFFKDKNGRFVSMATGYQIYNYVMYKHKEKTEKEIKDKFTIGIDDITTKFSNIRLMNEDEKKWYIDYKKLKYRRKKISFILSVILYLSAAYFALGVFSFIVLNVFEDLLQIMVMGIVFFVLAMLFNKISKREMTLIDKIKKSNGYIADCYSYDKRISNHSKGADYLIKVTDNNNHYLNEWFEIPSEVYKNSDVVNAKLILIAADKKIVDVVIE